MEQFEKSAQDTETDDFKGIEERESKLYKAASNGYFRNPDLIRFLMAENLALKLLLCNKELITPKEFDDSVKQARKMLDLEVRRQIDEWRKNNPQEAARFDVLSGGSHVRKFDDNGD